MNASLRLLVSTGLVICSTLVASAAIERTLERSFAVPNSGTLFVETHGGSIRVNPGNAGTVTVTARQRIRANSDREADEMLKKLDLSMEAQGGEVKLSARYERKPSSFWGSWPPVQVDFIVNVPADFATDLKTSGGGITVGDLVGKVKASTSGGTIQLGKLGGDVHAKTSGGNVSLAAAQGRVDLSTSGGSITVGRVDSAARLSTSGGNIRVDSVTGALHAHTSGGNIRAAIAGPLTDDSSLTTSGGSVRVTVDKSTAFRLDASTSGGSVDADGLAITSESRSKSRSRLAGDVNGGGRELKLRSSGGSVSVRTSE